MREHTDYSPPFRYLFLRVCRKIQPLLKVSQNRYCKVLPVGIGSESTRIEVEGGQPIEIIPNSFIVQLKSPEVGALEDTVGTMTADLTAAGGNVTAVYDQFGMFNVQFDVPEAGEPVLLHRQKHNSS